MTAPAYAELLSVEAARDAILAGVEPVGRSASRPAWRSVGSPLNR